MDYVEWYEEEAGSTVDVAVEPATPVRGEVGVEHGFQDVDSIVHHLILVQAHDRVHVHVHNPVVVLNQVKVSENY